MSDIEKIRQEIESLKELNEGLYTEGDNSYYEGQDNGYNHILAFIDSLPEEKPSKDLEEEIQGMYQAIFGTDIINRREMVYLETFDMLARHFAEWGAKHKAEKDLGWHSVEESLPPIDEEVIVLTDEMHGKKLHSACHISYGHIPNPEGWDGKSIFTGKVTHHDVVTYDGWNIPGVRYWMPMPEIPKKEKK